jgi:hypothetical protein
MLVARNDLSNLPRGENIEPIVGTRGAHADEHGEVSHAHLI